MAGFSAVQKRAERKPPRVVVFAPSIFTDDWRDRPTSEVAIGLRIPSDHEVSLARANAARFAWDVHPLEQDRGGRIEAMNDGVIREVCALAMCNANNVFEPYFPTPEDDVRRKLTSEGAKRIFDELEKLVLETSPVHREASDAEVMTLAEVLATPEAIDVLPAYKAKRARRLLAFLFDELLATNEV